VKIGRAVRFALATAALLAFGLSSAAVAAPRGAQTIDITIQNFSFQPNAITIEKGDTVRWTNQDSGVFHSAISIRPGFFTNPIGQGQVNVVVFDRPGTYDYVCGVHGQQMRGVIVVSGIADPTEAPTPDPNAHLVQDTFVQARPDYRAGPPGQSPLLYAAAALAAVALARFAWAVVRS
jgi:plastocyanin